MGYCKEEWSVARKLINKGADVNVMNEKDKRSQVMKFSNSFVLQKYFLCKTYENMLY